MQRRDGVRAIERAMVQIARSLDRRDLGRQVERRLGRAIDSSHLLVVDAIDEGSDKGEAPTIKDVAKWLDVHHSRASRMVKAAIRAELAVRVASQSDARKSCLQLSATGQNIAAAIREARTAYFMRRMKEWSKADCRQFSRLLTLFAETLDDSHGENVLAGPDRSGAPFPNDDKAGAADANVGTNSPSTRRARRRIRARLS